MSAGLLIQLLRGRVIRRLFWVYLQSHSQSPYLPEALKEIFLVPCGSGMREGWD